MISPNGNHVSVRNYNALWVVWGLWALLVMCWLVDGYVVLPLLFYSKVLLGVMAVSLVAYGFISFSMKKRNMMFSFDKNKKSSRVPSTELQEPPQELSEVSSPGSELVNSLSPVRVRKDTFISQGARLSGKIDCDANMTVEGEIDGDVRCEDCIKIEHSGVVKGEIHSQQIFVNGYVEGRIYASIISILAHGKVVGDIFADELSIEKGGVFTGQSNPLQPGMQQQENRIQVENKREKASKTVAAPDNVFALTETPPTP